MEKGELIGRGRTAEVYGWGSDRIVKLFMDWYRPEWVRHEHWIAAKVQNTGLPVPKTETVVEIEGRTGIVYERVYGETMLKLCAKKPWRLLGMAKELAKMHAEIHKYRMPELPSQKEALKRNLSSVKELPDRMKQQIIAVLDSLPEENILCHGDFHPDNILFLDRGPVVIDWGNATHGHPLSDVARTSVILSSRYVPPSTPAQLLLKYLKKLFHHTYLQYYFKLTGVSREQLDIWKIPVAAARLMEKVPGEQEQLLTLLDTLLKRYGSLDENL